MCCSERERESSKEGKDEGGRAGQLRSVLQQKPQVHPSVLRRFGPEGKAGGGAPQVINALSVFLPMSCRSGASQEEPKAGGE